MDNREHAQAANALIDWFNSQELAPSDASAIMVKVLAKILVNAVPPPHTAAKRRELNEGIDLLNLSIVHEVNERLFRANHRRT